MFCSVANNEVDKGGRNPLYWASYGGHVEGAWLYAPTHPPCSCSCREAELPSAESVRGIILRDEVWPELPDIRVLVQVSDAIGDVHCAPSDVIVRVLAGELLLDLVPQVSYFHTCIHTHRQMFHVKHGVDAPPTTCMRSPKKKKAQTEIDASPQLPISTGVQSLDRSRLPWSVGTARSIEITKVSYQGGSGPEYWCMPMLSAQETFLCAVQ